MKYTEDNIAEIISTEMFVKHVTRDMYDEELETIMRSIDRSNKADYKSIQICYKLHLGTKAILVNFGFKLEDEVGGITISWPNFKDKNYIFIV